MPVDLRFTVVLFLPFDLWNAPVVRHTTNTLMMMMMIGHKVQKRRSSCRREFALYRVPSL